jgi:DnaK suppressor protein
MATTQTKSVPRRSRYAELKTMLEERRRQLAHEVQAKMRDARADAALERDAIDQGEVSELDVQCEIDFALVEIKAQTLNKIEVALHRLWQGTYGDCFECGEEIAEARLFALPFAVRCKDCEEVAETVQQRKRIIALRGGSSTLGFDLPPKR